MPRPKRITKGNIVYHALNRANGRLKIFKKPGDFAAFEMILAEGCERFDMRMGKIKETMKARYSGA